MFEYHGYLIIGLSFWVLMRTKVNDRGYFYKVKHGEIIDLWAES